MKEKKKKLPKEITEFFDEYAAWLIEYAAWEVLYMKYLQQVQAADSGSNPGTPPPPPPGTPPPTP